MEGPLSIMKVKTITFRVVALDDLWAFNITSFKFKWQGGNKPESSTYSDTPSPRVIIASIVEPIENIAIIGITGKFVQDEGVAGLLRYPSSLRLDLSNGKLTEIEILPPFENATGTESFDTDIKNKIIIVFGGSKSSSDGMGDTLSGSIWTYHLTNGRWVEAALGSTGRGIYTSKGENGLPGARYDSYTAVDSVNSRLFIFGGFGFDENTNTGTLFL
jgi:hypothetical protein